jgi:hypothetical protein
MKSEADIDFELIREKSALITSKLLESSSERDDLYISFYINSGKPLFFARAGHMKNRMGPMDMLSMFLVVSKIDSTRRPLIHWPLLNPSFSAVSLSKSYSSFNTLLKHPRKVVFKKINYWTEHMTKKPTV